MSNIKSLDELRKIAMNTGEIEKHIKVIAKEIEDKIIIGLQKGMPKVKIPIFNGDYHFLACDSNHGAKIVLYNVLETLSKKNYVFCVVENGAGYEIIIDISQNKKEIKLLDAYIDKFLFKG